MRFIVGFRVCDEEAMIVCEIMRNFFNVVAVSAKEERIEYCDKSEKWRSFGVIFVTYES